MLRDSNKASSNAEERLSNYEEWMEFVEMDILSARYLMEAPFHPRPLAVVCYHAQQAAEKAVKALIVYYGSEGDVPKVHDILVLLNRVRDVIQKEQGSPIAPHVYELGARLNLFATAPRYPGELRKRSGRRLYRGRCTTDPFREGPEMVRVERVEKQVVVARNKSRGIWDDSLSDRTSST